MKTHLQTVLCPLLPPHPPGYLCVVVTGPPRVGLSFAVSSAPPAARRLPVPPGRHLRPVRRRCCFAAEIGQRC